MTKRKTKGIRDLPECPNCRAKTVYHRDFKIPHWKCFRCGYEFDVCMPKFLKSGVS